MARGYWTEGWSPLDDEMAFLPIDDPAEDPDLPDARDIDFLDPDYGSKLARRKAMERQEQTRREAAQRGARRREEAEDDV